MYCVHVEHTREECHGNGTVDHIQKCLYCIEQSIDQQSNFSHYNFSLLIVACVAYLSIVLLLHSPCFFSSLVRLLIVLGQASCMHMVVQFCFVVFCFWYIHIINWSLMVPCISELRLDKTNFYLAHFFRQFGIYMYLSNLDHWIWIQYSYILVRFLTNFDFIFKIYVGIL